MSETSESANARIVDPDRNRRGAVIIWMLMAVTFIGIIAAAMVRSTRGQARVSTSFTTVMNANLAVSNGIMATESFFSGREDDAIGKLKAAMGGNTVPVFDTRDENGRVRRMRIDEEQYFNSELVNVTTTADGKVLAEFKIDGGKNMRGRALRSATAYYEVENMTVLPGGSGSWGTNALYFGRSRLDVSNINSLTIKGGTTFAAGGTSNPNPMDRGAYYQVRPSGDINIVRFMPDSKGRGDVFFNGPVTFRSNTVFETNVFFNSYAELDMSTGGGTVFRKDVGFNEHIGIQGMHGAIDKNIAFAGNVWLNGGVRSYSIAGGTPSQLETRLFLEGKADKAFNYTLNAAFFVGGVCDADAHDDGRCKLHGLPPGLHMSPDGNNGTVKGGPKGFGSVNPSMTEVPPALMTEEFIRSKLTDKDGAPMAGFETRREPDLHLDIDPGRFYKHRNIQNSNPTGYRLTEFIGEMRVKAETDAELRKHFYPDHRTGHFLLDMDGCAYWNYEPGVLNEKVVMYNNTANPNFGPNFPAAGPDANVMIYVGPKGSMGMFDVAGSGLFRGLIYVHPDNASDFDFQPSYRTGRTPGNSNTFKGALLLNGGRRYDMRSAHFTIERDDDALDAFGCMLRVITGKDAAGNHTLGGYVGGACGGADIVKSPNPSPGSGLPSPRVNLRMIGICYHD